MIATKYIYMCVECLRFGAEKIASWMNEQAVALHSLRSFSFIYVMRSGRGHHSFWSPNSIGFCLQLFIFFQGEKENNWEIEAQILMNNNDIGSSPVYKVNCIQYNGSKSVYFFSENPIYTNEMKNAWRRKASQNHEQQLMPNGYSNWSFSRNIERNAIRFVALG